MVEHNYSGEWTETLKQKFVQKYLQFHSTAMKNNNFTTVYIDAFCGTGTRFEENITAADMFRSEQIERIEHDGSALISLKVKNKFSAYHFIDINEEYINQLKNNVANTGIVANISYYVGDSNEVIPKIIGKYPAKSTRFVVFLDPYKTEVDFSTLQYLAKSKITDVIYLFPWMALFRNLSHDPKKRTKFTDDTVLGLVGSPEFLENIWRKVEPDGQAIFEGLEINDEFVRDDLPRIQNKLTELFREAFSYVSEPVILKNKGSPLFLLYLLVANDSPPAMHLAERGAIAIRKLVERENLKRL